MRHTGLIRKKLFELIILLSLYDVHRLKFPICSNRSNWTVDIKLINLLWSNLTLETSKLVICISEMISSINLVSILIRRPPFLFVVVIVVCIFVPRYLDFIPNGKKYPEYKKIHEITFGQNGWFSRKLFDVLLKIWCIFPIVQKHAKNTANKYIESPRVQRVLV